MALVVEVEAEVVGRPETEGVGGADEEITFLGDLASLFLLDRVDFLHEDLV